MGQVCVRDCERRLAQKAEETHAPGGAPGISATANADVRVGASFSDPLAAIQGSAMSVDRSASPGPVSGTSVVPPIPGWISALGNLSRSPSPQGSPRFEEMSARSEGAGGASHRDPAGSPMTSPRPAEERPTSPSPSDLAKRKELELSYEGSYRGTMKHGFGKLRMQGSTYEGEFRDDFKAGNGVLTWDDGRQYRGQFDNGVFHGQAVMTWPDGRRYRGQYADDRKHGEGTFAWSDGRRYQGQWIVGKRHGIGVYTNAKGMTRIGTWQLDRPIRWEAVDPGDPHGHAIAARAYAQTTSHLAAGDAGGESVEGGREPDVRLSDPLAQPVIQSDTGGKTQPAEGDGENARRTIAM